MDALHIAEEIVAREGGFVNDPDDPGGATKYGVTLATMQRLGLDLDRSGTVTVADVRRLSKAQAVEIFLEHYYLRPRIAELPQALRASVFDMYVNAGANAVRILQRLLCDMGQGGDRGWCPGAADAQGRAGGNCGCAGLYRRCLCDCASELLFCAGGPAPGQSQVCAHAVRWQGRLDQTRRRVHVAGLSHDRGAVCRKGCAMGVIGKVLDKLGGGAVGEVSGAVRDVAEVWTVNAEGADSRDADALQGALSQYAAEFSGRGRFNIIMDAVNRLPRPLMTFGALGLMAAAMVDPIWFGVRMTGLALVPEPLWWILGAIVSFYFGSRHIEKRLAVGAVQHVAEVASRVPKVVTALRQIEALTPKVAETEGQSLDTIAVLRSAENPALDAWRKGRGR